MTNRPLSITVVGWGLISQGILLFVDLFIELTGLRSQEVITSSVVPLPIRHAISLTDVTITLACGYYLLQGRGWARWLFVIWSTLLFSYSFWMNPIKLPKLLGVIILLLITYLLFRPQARSFFSGRRAKVFANGKPTTRMVLSIFCYVVASGILCLTCLMAFTSAPGSGANEATHGVMTKWVVLVTMTTPSLMFLLIGLALSVDREWQRDIGIVLTLSAGIGSLLALTGVLLFMDPQFEKMLPTKKVDPFRDYATGVSWIALIGALGGLALFKARAKRRNSSREQRGSPQLPARRHF